MRSMTIIVVACADLMFGFVSARAMPVTTVAAGRSVARVIPVGGGCGPGAYRVGGVCRASSGLVMYRYQNGVRTSNAAGCMIYRPPFGPLQRFCR